MHSPPLFSASTPALPKLKPTSHRTAASTLWAAALGTAMLLLTGAPAQAASFQGLGDLPGGSFSSTAVDISADGSVVVGRGLSTNGFEAFRWTAAEGLVGLGHLPGGSFISSSASGVSADGSVIVGQSSSANGTQAFRWTAAEGLVGLGDLPGRNFFSFAGGVSADGSVIVGGSRGTNGVEAFRWTAAEGMVGLDDLPGGIFDSAANAVSADGSVVVGDGTSFFDSDGEAFRWTAEDGMVGLGDLPGGFFASSARDVSADGSVVVGASSTGTGDDQAFRWTAEDGMVGLAVGSDFFESAANGVSADGSIVVGRGFSLATNRSNEAFIWDSSNGPRALSVVLTEDFGLDLGGWRLFSATGISADGRTIVGGGENPDGNIEGWIVRLDPKSVPEPCSVVGAIAALGMGALLKRQSDRKKR